MPGIEWIGTLIGIGAFFGLAIGYWLGVVARTEEKDNLSPESDEFIIPPRKPTLPRHVSHEENLRRERLGLARLPERR